MCGIAGAYKKSAAEPVKRMTDQLMHRGPDGSGIDCAGEATLGHTRLAILDVESGQQPMRQGQRWISYNGEIYNHQNLRTRFLAGHVFRTHTDTETALHMYARYGPRCVEWLDGMFALAIVDDDGLYLARDPLGIKPLYYGAQDGTLYFASEIKALAKVTRDVHEFPAGHWYHTTTGLRHYRAREATPGQPEQRGNLTDPQQALPVIRDTLRRAVHKRLMSDVPLGVSLSGGLDSSIISALACEAVDRLDSFAVGMDGSSDLLAAREVAAFLGTRHHEFVYTEREILDALPDILFHRESFDPALVRSAVANYFLARLSSEHVKVILGGEGADELYAGYAYLGEIDQPRQLQAELVSITASLHNTNLQRTDRMSMAFGLEMRVPFLDMASVRLALGLPAAWKLHRTDRREKALLRNAFAELLPDRIVKRPKEKYSAGAGSAHVMARLADEAVSDADFVAERTRLKAEWDYDLPNKEALYYYRVLRSCFSDESVFPTMGASRSL